MTPEEQAKFNEQMVTVVLLVVVVVLIFQMVCREGFLGGRGYDAGNDLSDANDYDIMDMRRAAPYGPMGWVGSGAALAGVQERQDWMKNRFTTSARDNFVSSGFSADSVVNPGAIMAGPMFTRPDPRSFVGTARSSNSLTPVLDTQAMTDLIQYGNSY